MTETRDKFIDLKTELDAVLIDRQDSTTNALLALASGHHYLMLGPPGTAKSMLVRELCQRITGATYFEKLLSQFTVPEELFGPLDLIGYSDRGEYKRISKGALSEAHIGFLDEVYKANSAILNSLLTISNERLLHEVGFDPVRVPLLSLFAASNETPNDESLDALDDRFYIREMVEYITDESDFIQMLRGSAGTNNASITLDDIRQAQAEARSVKGEAETLQTLIDIRRELSTQGVICSDRRWQKALDVLKAYSWLSGRDHTEVEDLAILRFVLWRDPKDRRAVEHAIYKLANPLYLIALEVEDQAQSIVDSMPPEDAHQYTEALENLLQQLVDMHDMLKDKIALSKSANKQRAEESLKKVATLHKTYAAQMFKQIGRYELTR